MANNAACNDLAARFNHLADEGLVDVKFFLDTSDEASTETVCEEVNRLFAAVEAGNRYPLDFKDSVKQ